MSFLRKNVKQSLVHLRVRTPHVLDRILEFSSDLATAEACLGTLVYVVEWKYERSKPRLGLSPQEGIEGDTSYRYVLDFEFAAYLSP